MSVSMTFGDPTCQYPGCSNPTEAYVNVNSGMASSVPSRMEARCVEHRGVPVVWGPSDEALNEQVVELGLQLAAALKVVEAASAWRHYVARRQGTPRTKDWMVPEAVDLILAVEAWEAGA